MTEPISYGLNITKKTQAALERRWLKQLGAMNEDLSEAETVSEYLNVLQNRTEWNNLSFCLRRYVYESFSETASRKTPKPYTVTLRGKTYSFSAVLADVPLSEEERDSYADLLYAWTMENECYFYKEEVPNPKRGAISKQEYKNYLGNLGISRKKLFLLSLALQFNTAAMEDFVYAVGESPVYNFRSVSECIAFFCHSNEEDCSLAVYKKLERQYQSAVSRLAFETETDGGEQEESHSNITRTIGNQIDEIVFGEYRSAESRREAFLRYLIDHRKQFGEYSKTARNLFRQELESIELLRSSSGLLGKLTADYSGFALRSYVEREDSRGRRYTALMSDNEVGNLIYQMLTVQEEEENEEETDDREAGNPDEYDPDEVLPAEPLPIRSILLDSRVTGNLLDGARLRSILFEEENDRQNNRKTKREHITKKDFLIIRFCKLVNRIDFSELTDEERLELARDFQDSTDRVLADAGLPFIYAANPFDNLILTALCSAEPAAFIPKVFGQALKK